MVSTWRSGVAPGRGGPNTPSIAVERIDENSVDLRTCGDLDLSAAPMLATTLTEHFDSGVRVLRLDLRDVTFLDCTALGVLVDFHHRCRSSGGELVLAGVGRQAERLLRLTALHDVLTIDRDSAHPNDR